MHISYFRSQALNVANETSKDSSESQHSNNAPFVPSQSDPHQMIADLNSNLSPAFAEQNFFPSFFQPLQQHQAARPFSNRHHFTPSSVPSARYLSSFKSSFDNSILGSGDFDVVEGGTFFADGDRLRKPSHRYSHRNSGETGQPFALPLQSSSNSGDSLANFKDFADITASIDGEFSNNINIYTKTDSKVKHEPRNILEQLEMIDKEKMMEKEKKKLNLTSASDIK
ncbi:CLUMA_CG004894, isoform A [Clunio marinus]|uniref:CLUMA_CG004894, isoform A n=1 Tax=Clunio marinus TaxID=568069 RepID=A0A1J1HT86_9DIPT|nr:CLUMA_CG004894, isoform A [Clunio marinus]